jgi:hypothetical protein
MVALLGISILLCVTVLTSLTVFFATEILKANQKKKMAKKKCKSKRRNPERNAKELNNVKHPPGFHNGLWKFMWTWTVTFGTEHKERVYLSNDIARHGLDGNSDLYRFNIRVDDIESPNWIKDLYTPGSEVNQRAVLLYETMIVKHFIRSSPEWANCFIK